MSESGSNPQPPGRAYANYVLGALTVMYLFNYLDRWVLSILVEDIKEEFGASDNLMGFLLGPAFAVFYTTLGLPVARLADRRSRRVIISIAFAVWSLMTAVCGLARSSAELALARIGVGVGEAGGTAPAHSMLADYFPPERRAFAFGVFQQGVYGGQLVGLTAGAALAIHFDWRQTFWIFGLAGVAAAGLLFVTVREPARGTFDGPSQGGGKAPADAEALPTIGEVFRFLWQRRSFRGLAIGAGIAAFGGTGFGVWMPALLERSLGMDKAAIGFQFGTAMAVSSCLGALLAGRVTDILYRRDLRWLLWVPALSVLCSLPLLLVQAFAPTPMVAILAAIPTGLIGAGWAPPIYAATQRLAPARMRAIAASIIVLFITLLGQGGGPWAVGILSDFFEPEFGSDAIRVAMAAALSTYLIAVVVLWRGARTFVEDVAAVDASVAQGGPSNGRG